MSENGSTSIKSLHENNSPQAKQNDNNAQVVQEILNEIDSNDTRTNESNIQQQQYNLDQGVQQPGFAPQNQEEAMRMQQEMMQQQMMQAQMQQQMQMAKDVAEPAASVASPTPDSAKATVSKPLTTKILDQAKGPIIVAVIYFLLTVAPTKQLLMKIPKAIGETGNVTIIGTGILALLAGIIFFIVNMSVSKM